MKQFQVFWEYWLPSLISCNWKPFNKV